jgi:hypothetical protein
MSPCCAARAEVREHIWQLSAEAAPAAGGTVTVDLDGVLVIAHSDKEDAVGDVEEGLLATTR